MTLRLALVTLAVLTAPLAAQNPDPDKPVQGGGKLPTGWSARVDKDAAMTNVKFETMGPTGLHVTTGPAVILWKETDKGAGGFHTEATFTQTKAPQHPEAYGLFVAGKELKGAGQAYTYFIVRQDGKFMVRNRTGATTANVVPWTDHAAVVKAHPAGKATNKLEIAVAKDQVTFSVNGKVVHTMPAPAGAMDGIAGLSGTRSPISPSSGRSPSTGSPRSSASTSAPTTSASTDSTSAGSATPPSWVRE